MPIDPEFQSHRSPKPSGDLMIWQDTSSKLGIYGTAVGVDFDLCVGDGACIEVCPSNVFEWLNIAGIDAEKSNPTSTSQSPADRKAIPSHERDCIFCFGCEAVCPQFAIRVTPPTTVKKK